MKLSEEEIIKEVESAIWFMKEDNYNVNTFVKAIQGLLDLYKEKNKQIQVEIEGRNILVGLNENLKEELNKEKEKNKELLENATVTYFNDEELKESVGNYLGVLLKKNIEKDYISKNKIREIIYPTPTNPISYEIQTSDMYRKILQLLEEK